MPWWGGVAFNNRNHAIVCHCLRTKKTGLMTSVALTAARLFYPPVFQNSCLSCTAGWMVRWHTGGLPTSRASVLQRPFFRAREAPACRKIAFSSRVFSRICIPLQALCSFLKRKAHINRMPLDIHEYLQDSGRGFLPEAWVGAAAASCHLSDF